MCLSCEDNVLLYILRSNLHAYSTHLIIRSWRLFSNTFQVYLSLEWKHLLRRFWRMWCCLCRKDHQTVYIVISKQSWYLSAGKRLISSILGIVFMQINCWDPSTISIDSLDLLVQIAGEGMKYMRNYGVKPPQKSWKWPIISNTRN